MKIKKKLIFILPSLCAGGAERVISFVSQKINKNEFEVMLVVLGYKKDTVFEVDHVNVKYLNKSRLLLSIFSLFMVLKQEKPNIVVSSIGHVNLMMGFFSLYFKNIKFVGREASVVSKMNEFSNLNSKLNLFLMKLFYPRLTTIICQSMDMKNDFINTLQLDVLKLVVIHNPITNDLPIIYNENTEKNIKFITVGRLSHEKGYLRILKGLSTINSYNFTYTIVGSGPQLNLIKENVSNLGLLEKVIFIPYTNKVLELVSQSDVFIQGSFVEGFPNALLESCTVGTPIIAFNAPGGTKEIVLNGENGVLVKNEMEFENVLKDLKFLKTINKLQVKSSVMNRFNAKKILNQYENLFNNL